MSTISNVAQTSFAPRLRIPPLWLAITAILLTLIFAPILTAMLAYGNDYPAHMAFAVRLSAYGDLLPHFLYHVLLLAVGQLMPGGDLMARLGVAAALIGVIWYIWLGLLVYLQLTNFSFSLKPRFRWAIPLVLTVVLLVAGPINLFTWWKPNLYWGYLLPNTYHNPTIVLLKPFTLVIFGYCVQAFSHEKVGSKGLFICGVMGILATLAKPSYSMVLLPALALLTAYGLVRSWRINWRILIAVVVPITAVLAWQFLFYGGKAGGFEFAPFKVMSGYSDNLLVHFLLSIVFPTVVYLLYYSEAHRRIDLNLAWLTFVVAAAYTYLLAEGRNSSDGNFTWGTQVTLFILFIQSVLFLLRLRSNHQTAPRWKYWICWLCLSLHLLGGVALYLTTLTPEWQNRF